jgi:predicted amidohydrolase YtcJ
MMKMLGKVRTELTTTHKQHLTDRLFSEMVVYEELAKEKKLPIRVFLTIYHQELELSSSPTPKQTCGPLLTAQRVKIISDGALGSETAGNRI